MSRPKYSKSPLEIVGRRIRQERIERGLNQLELAAELADDLSRSAISNYEIGRHLPSLGVLVDIAKVFGIPPAALLLDPAGNPRERCALALLSCSHETVTEVTNILDAERQRTKLR